MTNLRRAIIALPFVAAAALGACSDSDDNDDDAAETLTEAEFVTQANAICADAGGADAFFAQEGDPWASVNDQATELGLDECAEA